MGEGVGDGEGDGVGDGVGEGVGDADAIIQERTNSPSESRDLQPTSRARVGLADGLGLLIACKA